MHPRSESTEDIQDARKGPLPQTRQRKRNLDEDKDLVTSMNPKAEDEEAEEEEVTRCICGEQEYPGMPVLPAEILNRRNSKSGIKDTKDVHSSSLVPEIPVEDAGGMFIQCDTCKVWQHGGCVGVMDGMMGPDEPYFCEQCRPDLHTVNVGATGWVQPSHYWSSQSCEIFTYPMNQHDADKIRPAGNDHHVTSLCMKNHRRELHQALQVMISNHAQKRKPNLPAKVQCLSAPKGGQQ